jgi:hypothetical protein
VTNLDNGRSVIVKIRTAADTLSPRDAARPQSKLRWRGGERATLGSGGKPDAVPYPVVE